MRKGLFPGTFNPPSKGHLDLISRATLLCDELIVAVAFNSDKPSSFISVSDRVQMIQTLTTTYPNVTVTSFSGLVVDFAKRENITILVRGLRNVSDFEFESQMALMNQKMTGIETIFLIASEQQSYIRSTLIREIALNGRRLHEFVPEAIEAQVFNAFQHK
jgi:pantetheine-phosphate adenylyltransferase